MSRRHDRTNFGFSFWQLLERQGGLTHEFVPSAPTALPRRRHAIDAGQPIQAANSYRSSVIAAIALVAIGIVVTSHLNWSLMPLWEAVATQRRPDADRPPFSIKGAWREIDHHKLPLRDLTDTVAPPWNTAQPSGANIADTVSLDAQTPNQSPIASSPRPILDQGAEIPPQHTVIPVASADTAMPSQSSPIASTDEPLARQVPSEASPQKARAVEAPTEIARAAAVSAETPAGSPQPPATSLIPLAEQAELPPLKLIQIETASASEPPASGAVPAEPHSQASAPLPGVATEPNRQLSAEPSFSIVSHPPVPRRKPTWIAEQGRPPQSEKARTETSRAQTQATVRPIKSQPVNQPIDAPARGDLFRGLGHASP